MVQHLHVESQRRNLNIAADAYTIATTYAGARGISISAAVSELLRRAEQAPEPPSGKLKTGEYGYLVVRATGKPITPESVKAALEDGLDD